MALGYLVCPTIQIQDINGKPIVGAKIYVYDANTSELTNTYKDFEGHLNTNPVLTDDLGNCTIVAENTKVYNIVVNDNNDNLLFSKENLTVDSSVTFLSVDPGYGIQITQEGSNYVISVDTDLIATQDDLATKQDKLYAGNNIEIDDENQINVVGRRELQAKYPIRLDRSNNALKVYLDEDYVPGNDRLLPGPDIAINRNAGYTYIGVDTNSTSHGYYNFYAGNSNTVSGDYNAVFGYAGSVNGNGNFIAGEYGNSISGHGNAVFGENNSITNNGAYNLIQGSNNIVNHGLHNIVVGTMNESDGYDNAIFGNNNTLADFGSHNFIDGQNNIINTGSCNIVAGYGNETHGYQNIIAGYENKTNALTDCLVIGEQNNTVNATIFDSLLYGEHNNLSGNNYHNSIIGGDTNTISANNGVYDIFLLGDHNSIATNNQFRSSIIQGDHNTIDKLNTSLIVGNYNNVSAENAIVLGDGHNVSTNYNTRLGKYSTNGDYLFAIGNGSNGTHRSNVFEVRNTGDIYYKYRTEMLQLKPVDFADYRTSISKEYTIVSNNENINVVMSDEFQPIRTWLNSNYKKMSGPLFFNLKIQFDSQVQNAGMILLDFGYGYSLDTDPVITNPSKYAYLTKFWTGLSDATTFGYIDAKEISNNTSLVCNIRNIENNAKWTADQKVIITIDFYTRYDNR